MWLDLHVQIQIVSDPLILVEIHSDSPLRYALRTGDIVKKVNDESIERPEHFMRAWSLVARSSELWILIERDQHEMMMRWTIK